MTAILGISAFYHDSAAAIVVDGQIVAAAQEERFTRQKHDSSFPQNAIDYCLREARVAPEEIDYVGFYEKPVAKFVRLLETYLAFAPAGYRSFRQALPSWLKQKLFLPREMKAGLRGKYSGRFVFLEHHQSHAASAFFPSPFDEAAILTVDGVGEWSTTCWGIGRGNAIELIDEIRFPHSLGLLYSAFAQYLGFRVNSGEHKMMGLAPYGKPVYIDQILSNLLDLKDDGSYCMDMRYFNYCQGLSMTSDRFHKLFNGPPRDPNNPITQREMNLAASIQVVTENVILRMARHVHQVTGMKNLVLAGGVALNCVANGRLRREGPFEKIWIQPATGDAGGALGTALFIWHQLLERPRNPRGADSQQGSLLGPSFSHNQIVKTLEQAGAVFTTCESDEQLCEKVVEMIAQEQVVGWFQGRLEYGPRSLGSRSIFADARCQNMQSILNQKIKFRESFRPFAAIVLQAYVDQCFEMDCQQDSPYMLFVASVRDAVRSPREPAQDRLLGLDKLRIRRSNIPAVTHVDYSTRIQTVDHDRNPLLYKLLSSFFAKTGCPVLINTSFNVRGEPIVHTPVDAYRCFMMTDMDVLVLGRNILLKVDQRGHSSARERDQFMSQFAYD